MKPWRARSCVPVWLFAAWLTTMLFCSPMIVADPATIPRMPECQLTVTGGQARQITAASIRCIGRAQADIAVDSKLLGKFQADFTGVSATSSCRPKAGCLITVCTGTLVFRNSSVSWVAGAPLDNLVCVLSSSHVEVHNSRFMHNTARPLACFDQSHLVLQDSSLSHNMVRQGSGGGLSAEGGATVVITNGSRVHNNTAGQAGGGVFASGNANVMLTGRSSVTNNAALDKSGGGVAVTANASLTLSGHSSVHNNNAAFDGGGVLAENHTDVIILDNSSVHNNLAGCCGGGIAVWDNARVLLTNGSSVHSNMAQSAHGGGVLVTGGTLALTRGSSVHSNNASKDGGGLYAAGSAVVRLHGSSSVHNNTAGQFGGGVAVYDNATVTLNNGSSAHSNTALHIGGVAAYDNATMTFNSGSSVHSNAALQVAGGVAAYDAAVVMFNSGSSVHSNTARQAGGGVAAYATAAVTFNNGSSVHNNTTPEMGAGIIAGNSARVAFAGGTVHNNRAGLNGGGVMAGGNVTVVFSNGSSVHSNVARNGTGGGVYLVQNASVSLADRSTLHDNKAGEAAGGLFAWGSGSVTISSQSQVHSNKALHGPGGGMLVGGGVVVRISGNSRIVRNVCYTGVGGGMAVGVDGYVIKFGDKGLRSSAVDSGVIDSAIAPQHSVSTKTYVQVSGSTIGNNTSYLSAGGGLAIASTATVELTNGTQVVGNWAVNGSGGAGVLIDQAVLVLDDSVSFVDNVVSLGFVGGTLAAFDKSSLKLPLRGNLTKCSAGVYLGRTPCEEGETLVYDVCTCCPRHTYSFDNTTVCAQCPANGECLGGSLVDPSLGYWQSSSRSIEMHRCPLYQASCNHTILWHSMTQAGTVQTCNPGYQGNLCGACRLPEYGMVSSLRCSKCMRPAVQVGLYVLACCATVVFIAYTVHATWQDNLQGGQSVRPSDLIKVLVQFLQYVVIIGSVSIPWPAGFDLKRWFQVASSVFGASSGEALSVDCWLYHYIPQLPKGVLHLAMQRQLVYFLAPVGLLVAVVVLQCLAWAAIRYVLPLICWRREAWITRRRNAFMVVRKLPVTVLVLTYYAYPTLVKASLGFFACLRIDTAAAQPGLPAPLNHPLGYWVNDIQQACFTGYHLGWALGLGLPSLLLWCITVPIAMGLGLKLAGKRVDADNFREHFGFLYRNYRPERIWWEAVWAARTVLLTLVAVFAFPMDRYFSVLALLVLFWVSAMLQLVFKPYAMPTLHHMHLVSTSCLAATTFGALAMFAYDIQENAAERLRYVIAALVFLVNVVFVGWCCARLAPVAKEWCISFVRKATACACWVIKGTPGHRKKPTRRQGRSTLRPMVPLGNGHLRNVTAHAVQQ